MAPPFEVVVSPNLLYLWLWAVRRGARAVYAQELLRREVLSYLAPWRFFDLHAAVAAALSTGGAGEVRLVRNVTLPAPLNNKALCQRLGSLLLWATVRSGAALTLRSTRGGPWRIRHHVPGGNGGFGCALFRVGRGARLIVRDVGFEVVCIPGATPVKAHLAVLPPMELTKMAALSTVELPEGVQARGYDSRLVAREAWAFFT